MELILIRHGRPLRVESTSGPADPPLDDEGRRQANLLASWLEPESIDALYSSPLQRALETAEPIAAARKLEVIADKDLTEIALSENAYIPIEDRDAAEHPVWKEWKVRLAHQESDPQFQQFRTTVRSAIDRIVVKHAPADNIAITCHGGVINAVLTSVLQIPKVAVFNPGYTSVSRIVVSRNGTMMIKTVNEVAHLRPEHVPSGLLHDAPY